MSRLLRKLAYFQGGGGVNEPTPGEKKYKSDPAIVVQPRFKEPFYRNYDLYTIPGMEDIGPGTGYHGLQNYKSVGEFLEARRKRLAPRYKADDSWIQDNGERTKSPNIKARAELMNRIIKTASTQCQDSDIEYTDRRDAFICGKCLHMGPNGGGPTPTAKELHTDKNHNPNHIDYRNDAPQIDGKSQPAKHVDENDGANFDYGDGAYTAMSEGKKMKTITDAPHKSPGAFFADAQYMLPPKEHGTSIYNWKNSPYQGTPGAKNKKKDSNDIDFPIDDMVNRQDQMIYPEEDEYQIRKEKGDRYQFPSEGSPLDPGELNISMTTPQIAGEHSYLPDPDFEGKSDNGSQLDFGRDYTEETLPGRPTPDEMSSDDKEIDLDQLEAKYLGSTEVGLFGLPDGVDPEGHDADELEQVEQPYTGTSDIGTQPYDDKWNI